MTKIRSTDASGIDDLRGSSGGSGGLGGGLGGLGSVLGGGGAKVGGGLIGIVVLLAALFLPKLLGGGGGVPSLTGGGDSSQAADAADGTCNSELEQIVCGAVDSVQEYWTTELPQTFGVQYQAGRTKFFTGEVSTGCGTATSQTGPFYCPADQSVYIDLRFMQQLENELIGTTNDLAEQYIVAHEFGHHVQNLLGTSDAVARHEQSEPAKAHLYSEALELQADCYAGTWIHAIQARGELDSNDEVDEAFDAANGVGDDYIQSRGGGDVDPDTFTHGTSAQREKWLKTGIDTGDPTQCDGTFAEVGVSI
ncbi:MAG: neutral zinc metallopeptidase [Ilumatobacteraceae bacterium]